MRCAASAVSTRSASSSSAPVSRPAAEAADVGAPPGERRLHRVADRLARTRAVPALLNSTSASGPNRGAGGARRTASGRCWPCRRRARGSAQRLDAARPPTEASSRETYPGLRARRARRRGVLDRAAGGVDADVGVLGLLVRRGDAGELGDLAAPRLGVEALAVAALALLERRGHVDQEERAAGVVDHRPDLLAGLVERARSGCTPRRRRGGRSRRPPSRSGGCWSRGPRGEGQAGRQVPAYDVAVEAGHRALALLEQQVDQRAGERRLAAAGQTGEEEHQPLLRPAAGGRGRRSRRRRRGSSPSLVAPVRSTGSPPRTPRPRCTPRSWSASASPCEASGTVTTTASGRQPAAAARVARTRPTGESHGVPVPVSASSTTGARGRAGCSSSAVGEGVARPGRPCAPAYRSRTCAGVRWQAAERAVLGVGQRARPRRRADETRASGSPSGSTSSTVRGPRELGRQRRA